MTLIPASAPSAVHQSNGQPSPLRLAETPVPGQRLVSGHVFPLVLTATLDAVNGNEPPSLADSTAYLSALAASGELSRLLRTHGAVLFRGLGHASPETFSALVHAAEQGRGSRPFEQIGLAGKRNHLAKEVFTANEGPPDRRFYQHNEYARYTHFPSNIHFYCEVPATQGGETPVASSVELYDRVRAELPEFIDELARRGLTMRQVYRAPGNEGKFNWQGKDSFGHTIEPGDDVAARRAKAEVQARRLTDDFRWLEDGSLEITQHLPAFRRLPDGRAVWFNGLVGRHGTTRDIGALDSPNHVGRDGMTYLPTRYDDGTTIPRRYLDRVLEISREVEFELTWEAGDLLLVDNYSTSHGRCPWQAGERKILVSMWETGEGIAPY